jgi:phosphate transport system substrate-binding protein
LSHVQAVVRNAGSDTMVNVAQAWAEEYAKVKPSVSVEVSGGGSATGIAGLIDGVVDLANSSRRMEPRERRAAEEKTHHGVVETIAGFDALAVFVRKDHPVSEVSLEQLAAMYGKDGALTRWSQLTDQWPQGEDDRILLISRQSNSGTYEYFRNAILGKKGEFRAGTRDLNGSKEVVSLIASTRAAVGVSGMGYATPEVKMLRVNGVGPTLATAKDGTYRIARPLYIYSLQEARPEIAAYLEWILSAEGQRVLRKSGYVPVN